MERINFEELEVWREGKDIAVDIIKMWKGIDNRGYFGLQDQMQRSAISISSNIAEGKERRTVTEFARFLFIAKGSVAELRTQLYIFRELEISKSIDVSSFIERTLVLSRKISRLISSLSGG